MLFNVEFNEDIVLYPGLTSSDVCITFEFIEDLEKRSIDYINSRENWNVDIANQWLVHQFIAKVLGPKWNDVERRNDDPYKLFLRNDSEICYLSELNCINYTELYYVVQILQRHYYSRPHSRYRISKQDFNGIYDSIILCLKRSREVDMHYLCEKLHLSMCGNKAELIEAIEDISEQITDLTIDGFGIDYLFRSLYAALGSKKVSLNKEEIKFIRKNLTAFVDIHDREVLLEKYALEFI